MNTRQLEAIIWIAKLGSFAAAAARLNVTQPTISLRVKELESHLGITLFDRSGHRARLTDRGQSLIPYAERMVALGETIRRQIGNPAILTGTVRVGVAELVALTWLPILVEQIKSRHPGVTVDLDIDLTIGLWEKFEKRALDVVLLPGPINRPLVNSVYLGGMRFSWMSSTQLKIPRQVLGPADIARWPIILLSLHSVLYPVTEKYFHNAETPLCRLTLCNNLNTIAAMTRQGLGISTLPPGLFEEDIAAGRLQILHTHPSLPAVEYWAVCHSEGAGALAATVADLAGECTRFDAISEPLPGQR